MVPESILIAAFSATSAAVVHFANPPIFLMAADLVEASAVP